MPFTINIPKTETAPEGPKALVADRRLYIADDQRTMVEHGDIRGAYLLVGPGGSIAGADVARFGLSLVDGRVVQDAPTEGEAPADPEKAEAHGEPEKVEAPADEKPVAIGKREKK